MVHIYSRKAYTADTAFGRIVEETASIADSREHHTELIQEEFPDLTVVPYYTYEHGGTMIEAHKRCAFDSSADAYVAYDDPGELDDVLLAINSDLQGEDYEYDDYDYEDEYCEEEPNEDNEEHY